MSGMSRFSIRCAREQDDVELARLAGELGYPVSAEMMRARLQRLLDSSSDAVFIAASADGSLAGWIHGALSQYLESDFRVEIAGLVVDARWRRQGAGRALVGRVEQWAREHGAVQSSVRCRTTRPGAHLFYKSLGYAESKTQIVFRKSL